MPVPKAGPKEDTEFFEWVHTGTRMRCVKICS